MRGRVLPRSIRFAKARLAAGLLVAACLHGVPTHAQDFDPLLEIRIAEAVQDRRAGAALALIDGALANAPDDRKLTEDLLSRKAALEAEIGRHAEALATLQRLRESVEARLGTAGISLPPQHLPGKIERPSVWTLDFREDPGRHVVLQSVPPLDGEEAYRQMREQLAQNKADSAFVFVHGFNVPFDEAAQRTAQMAYDMNFDGLPILYSWPSRGSVLSYIADTAVVNLSGRRLSLFLEDLVARSGAKRIHLVAHSMGNRAMTDALELFALRNSGKPPAFDQVLFTAPDIDAGLFSEMMRTIRPVARRVTLYASDKDWALAVSRRVHGDAARAGQGATASCMWPRSIPST